MHILPTKKTIAGLVDVYIKIFKKIFCEKDRLKK